MSSAEADGEEEGEVAVAAASKRPMHWIMVRERARLARASQWR